jgi:class 3 adenylate cyclase/tetratricopeptide (TPR) repeat protein
MASDRTQRRIDSLLDEAEEAIAQLEWQVVRSRAQAVIALDPANPDAANYLAAADRTLGGPVPQPATQSSLAGTPSGQPASFANGRYQIKQLLGEGGKKKVYQAHDGILDRDVALAVIKSEGLDEISRTRITREAQAMGRLGDHPNILQIHDLGEDDGQPYLVLPLMSGGSIEGLIDNAPDHRIGLEQALELSKGVCRGLEFAHSRGIVHRDLKPGNIWLTGDSSAGSGQTTAKIGDFGLAVVLDRSRITGEGMMVGTVSYMPPEQAMGGDVTPRSDLYSLGAMLYEMVTGRPPFLGDDAVAIIGQHINTPPVSPIWHNAECARPLEALILRLLAKNPAERPQSATEVLTALEGIDLYAPVEDRPSENAPSLDSLAGGVFVGRQQEMGEMKAALEDALSGRGRLVMLVGEPGIGKTRTAQELATYAGLRGAQVLWGRCYEEQGMPPYWPWVQAIRSYVRDRDPEQLRTEMGAGAADIAGVVSDVRERLPDLPTPPEEAEQARFRLFDSITNFLKRAGQTQPLVLMLDDLHWADKPSLLLLEFLARELSGARLLIVGTYRDMELSRQYPLAESLGGLNRERLFQRVLLRGLSQEDVGRFIEITSGIAPPTGLVDAVHTQTEGNPLFVTELVRLLVQEGEVTADRTVTRESWTVRIPEGVREVIGRRLNRLSQRCNETLTMASVIGREFELRQLSPLIQDMSEDRLLEVLEESLNSRVIEELPQAVGRYQFTHALIQETLLEELSTTRRVRLHARIAQVLEQLYGDDAESHAAELAHHFAEAESVLGAEKLVSYSSAAGERAIAVYAWEEAEVHFQRALDAKKVELSGLEPAADRESAELLFGLGRAQVGVFPLYRVREAIATLSRAFNYYADVKDVERALAVVGYPIIAIGVGRRTERTNMLERAMTLIAPDTIEEGRLLSEYGFALGFQAADYDRAQEAFNRALAIARREGDAALEMRTLCHAARIDVQQSRTQEAMEKCLLVLQLAPRGNDPAAEASAHQMAGNHLLMSGDPEAARYHASGVMAPAERVGDRFSILNAYLLNLRLEMLIGNWVAAREFSIRGMAISPLDARLLYNQVMLEYQTGDFGQGQVYIERLLEVMQITTPGPNLDTAYLALAVAQDAQITGTVKRADIAKIAAETILSSTPVTRVVALLARTAQAIMSVLEDDAAAAAGHYVVLESESGRMLSNNTDTRVDRVLGMLDHTVGNLDQAAGHFEAAVAFCRKAGYRPELAWTCCDYADLLNDRDAEGDRARAVALLDESLAISSELGMRPLMERVLSRKLEIQGVASVDIRTSIDVVASAVADEQPNLRPHAAPDGTVTILFSDIEGSTEMTERLGDQRMQQVLRGHNDIVRHQVAAFGGFEVKSLGDGFMLAFASARRALQCAMAVQRAFSAHNQEHPEEPVLVRMGLHTGEFVQEMDDFFGKNVILASRIADRARGGEILVSSLLKELTDSAGDISFGDGQEVELKGLAGLNRVYQVDWK